MCRLVRDVLAFRRHHGDGRSDFENHFVEEKPVRWSAPNGDIAIRCRKVPPVQHGDHAGQSFRLACVDLDYPGMRMRATRRPGKEHAWHPHVLGVLSYCGHDAEPVQTRNRLAYDLERLRRVIGRSSRGRSSRRSRLRGRRLSHLLRVERQDGLHLLWVLTDHLVPLWIFCQHLPVGVGQTGCVRRVLHDANWIDFQSHLILLAALRPDRVSQFRQSLPHPRFIQSC